MPETYLTVQVFKFNMCVLQNQDKASVGHINLSCKRSPLSLCILLVLVILCVFCCKQFLCINFKTWCWIINTWTVYSTKMSFSSKYEKVQGCPATSESRYQSQMDGIRSKQWILSNRWTAVALSNIYLCNSNIVVVIN